MSNEQQSVQVRKDAVYVGRRMTTKDKLAHFWLYDGEERARGFAKQPVPATIGEKWTFTFTDQSLNNFYLSGERKPVQSDLHQDYKQVQQWVACDVAAEQHYQDVRANKKLAARKSEFERALEPLKALCSACSNHDERHAFIKRVESELWRR